MSKSSYSFLIFIFLYSCQEVTQTEINKTDNLELKDSISALSSLPESNLSFPPIRINEEGLSDNLTLDELQYDSILAYSFDGFHERTSILKLLQNRRFQYISDYKKLNDRSGNKLIHILSSKSSFGFSTAACFQPSLGILFFKQGRTVYEVNICLDCNSLSSSSPLQAQLYQDKFKSLDSNI